MSSAKSIFNYLTYLYNKIGRSRLAERLGVDDANLGKMLKWCRNELGIASYSKNAIRKQEKYHNKLKNIYYYEKKKEKKEKKKEEYIDTSIKKSDKIYRRRIWMLLHIKEQGYGLDTRGNTVVNRDCIFREKRKNESKKEYELYMKAMAEKFRIFLTDEGYKHGLIFKKYYLYPSEVKKDKKYFDFISEDVEQVFKTPDDLTDKKFRFIIEDKIQEKIKKNWKPIWDMKV